VLTIVAVVLALTVLPSPWGWIAVIGAAAIDVAETAFFVRWSKRRRATVGVETLVGRPAVVVRARSPRGPGKGVGAGGVGGAAKDLQPGDEGGVVGGAGRVRDGEAPHTNSV
jgi:membrane protein implicated in regulation of membrane protease activity